MCRLGVQLAHERLQSWLVSVTPVFSCLPTHVLLFCHRFALRTKKFLPLLSQGYLYGSHRFRTGAATAAAANKLPASAIQTAERWESQSYRDYMAQPGNPMAQSFSNDDVVLGTYFPEVSTNPVHFLNHRLVLRSLWWRASRPRDGFG